LPLTNLRALTSGYVTNDNENDNKNGKPSPANNNYDKDDLSK